MLGAVLYGKEDVRVEQAPVPEVGTGEIRVRIQAALTCGTDVKVYRRGYHARMICPPSLFGHEFAGVIDAVGPDSGPWTVGRRVVAANSAPCGACFYCLRNRSELCEDLLFLNGAYAQQITVPERIVRKNLLPIPDHVSYAEAALVEPLACVVRGIEETPVRAGETVAVLGTGPIGLLFVCLLKRLGARVLAVGRRLPRLALARRLGAQEVFALKETPDLLSVIRGRTEGGRGPDVVVEAVGLPAVWETAIALVRRAGLVNLFGGCPADTQIRLDTHRMHYDEITLKGTFHHTPQAVRTALHLIAEGVVPASVFLEAHAPLTGLPDVLAGLACAGGAIKTVIEPNR